MTDPVEHYTKIRYWLLTILGVTYLLAQLASLSFTNEVTGLSEESLKMIDNFGFIIFTLTVFAGAWAFMSARNKGESVTNALFDELTKSHLQRAVILGFKFVFFLSLFLFLAAKFDWLTAEDVARSVFTACLVVPYLRFAYLESRDA